MWEWKDRAGRCQEAKAKRIDSLSVSKCLYPIIKRAEHAWVPGFTLILRRDGTEAAEFFATNITCSCEEEAQGLAENFASELLKGFQARDKVWQAQKILEGKK